jgi:hypothetical protein
MSVWRAADQQRLVAETAAEADGGLCAPASKKNDIEYEYINNYFYMSNICLPKCMDGYMPYPADTTLCIASNNVCYNTADLSSNILDSWRQTCGPIKRTELNLTSTINSISTVKVLMNSNTTDIGTMLRSLSNSVFYPSSGTPATNISIRNLRYPYVLSNYLDAYAINSNVDFNYNTLRTKKSAFDTIYNDFLCSNYN